MNQFLVILWYFDLSRASVSSFYGTGLVFLILNQCMLIFSISSEKSLNLFDFVLILDNFKAMYLIAVFIFFNNQKIGEKCDPMRSSRMIFVNPFRFESSFNVGCPLKI